MAIATIKYDEHNRPKRAKYRIVVLENHDPHLWSKDAVAAPVMSQLKLRILTSLAVFNHRVLKIVTSNRPLCSHPYLPMKIIFCDLRLVVHVLNQALTGV